MSRASDTRAGGAYVELSLRNTQFVRGLRNSLAQFKAFGASLQSLGAGMQTVGRRLSMFGVGIVAPLLLSARAFAKAGENLDKLNKSTGASVESLSEISYAAEQVDTDIASVTTGFRMMQKVLAAAGNGDKGPARAISDLGFSLAELQKLSPDEQFEMIGKRITEIEDPALRSAAAMKMFGRSGTDLLPMLADLGALRAEARRLGITMSQDDVKSALALDDAMDRLGSSLKRVVLSIGGALAPLLTEFGAKLLKIASGARRWIDQNKGLIVSILKIGAAAIAAGALLFSVGLIVRSIGGIFVTLSSVAASALAFMLSPIGMIVAAVTLLGATIVWATGNAGKVLKWLGEKFAALQNFAVSSFQGMADALAAGNIELAAKVLWASLKVVWTTGLTALKDLWSTVRTWFTKLFGDVFFGWAVIFTNACATIKKTWTTTVAYLATWLLKLKDTFWNVFDWIGARFEKTFAAARIEFSADKMTVKEKREAYDQAVKDIDTRTDAAKTKRESETKDATGKIMEDLRKEENEIKTAREKKLAEISDEWNKEDTLRTAADEKYKAENAKELADAKTEWNAAKEAAKKARQTQFVEEGALSGLSQGPKLPAAPDMGELEDRIRGTIDVMGMFGAGAADRIGVGGTAAERTAKAAEGTEKNTKKIQQQLEGYNYMAFA